MLKVWFTVEKLCHPVKFFVEIVILNPKIGPQAKAD
jgi:hypothetical protein